MPVRIAPPPAQAPPRVREEAPWAPPAPDPGAPPLLSVLVAPDAAGPGLPGRLRDLAAALEEAGEPFEILVAGSVPESIHAEAAAALSSLGPRARMLSDTALPGIGAALRAALREARGDHLLVAPDGAALDGDRIRAFLEAMEPSAGFAYLPGSRGRDVVVGYRPGGGEGAGLAARARRWAVRLAFRTWLRDFTWICLYRRSLFEKIDFVSDDDLALPEILIRARRAGVVMAQIPCPAHPHRDSSLRGWTRLRRRLR